MLRGGGEQFLEEMDRSVHDAIMIVRRARTHKVGHLVVVLSSTFRFCFLLLYSWNAIYIRFLELGFAVDCTAIRPY